MAVLANPNNAKSLSPFLHLLLPPLLLPPVQSVVEQLIISTWKYIYIYIYIYIRKSFSSSSFFTIKGCRIFERDFTSCHNKMVIGVGSSLISRIFDNNIEERYL